MRDKLEDFIVVHPYSREEYIQVRLRELGCDRFSVIDLDQLENLKVITHDFTRLDALKYNPTYPDVWFTPSLIFIQYGVIVDGIQERVLRSDIGMKEVELKTRMSLVIPTSHSIYWEDSSSFHDYINQGPSLINSGDLLYKDVLIRELATIGRYVKGIRYTLRFNYESFLKLCKYLNKSLKYV